jgi:hypothetical protein
MSVGVGVGLIFLMREGLSLENLRRMPDEEPEESVVEELRPATPRERARMSG